MRRARPGRRSPLALILGVAPMLLGCTLGPNFSRPQAWSPARWHSAPAQSFPLSEPVAAPIRAEWWTIFGDPELTFLEQRAVRGNLDVEIATIRLAESRAQRRITTAAEFPQVNGEMSYGRERPSPLGELSLLGGAGGGASGAPSSTPIGAFNLWQYGFDASWELDLWGRVRRSIEAADASVDASAEARRGVLLSTLAEVARDYIDLRGVQTQYRIAQENDETAAETLRLTGEKARNGLASQLQTASAAAELAAVAATLPQLEQQQAAAINRLGLLLDLPPRALAAELGPPLAVPPVPPTVPIGLPSELAQRRPDIREAEARLHAAVAEIGAAQAAFYPRITLGGSLDIQALHFGDLGNWNARTYSLGPSISIPLFEGGRLSGNLALTKAEQKAAAVDFQRTVLRAWQEVDDALEAYRDEQRRNERLLDQVDQARRALTLARRQYQSGMTDFLYVLQTQRQVLEAERQQADSAATVSADLVSLYKALGGGWDDAAKRG